MSLQRLLPTLARPLRAATRPVSLRAFATAVSPPKETAAPHEGIPFKADPEPVAGVPESAGFTPVQLPDMQEQVVVSSLRIPIAPDNYQPSHNEDTDFPTAHEPKVFTVTPPAAREGGGPVLATTSDDVQPGQSGDSTTSLPKEHVAPPTKEEEPHKFDGTPLTDEERRGALVLGGILLGGWLLGGFAKPKKVKKSKSGADEAKDKADSKAKELAK